MVLGQEMPAAVASPSILNPSSLRAAIIKSFTVASPIVAASSCWHVACTTKQESLVQSTHTRDLIS